MHIRKKYIIYEKSNCERFINMVYKKATITILKVQSVEMTSHFGGFIQQNFFQTDKFS